MRDAFGVERGDIAKRGQEAKLVAQTLERVAGAKQARAAKQVADKVATRHTRAAANIDLSTPKGTKGIVFRYTAPKPPEPPKPPTMPNNVLNHAVPADVQLAGNTTVAQGRAAAAVRQQRQQRRNVALGVGGAAVLGGGGAAGAGAAYHKKNGRVHVGA